MNDPGVWVSLLGLAFALITGWVKLNNKIATMETRAVSEKAVCDASLALIRTEVVAVETRGNNRLGDLKEQLNRIDGKVDRLLERHGHD